MIHTIVTTLLQITSETFVTNVSSFLGFRRWKMCMNVAISVAVADDEKILRNYVSIYRTEFVIILSPGLGIVNVFKILFHYTFIRPPPIHRWNVDRFHSFFIFLMSFSREIPFSPSGLSSFKYLIWNEIDEKKTSDYLLLWFLIVVKRILIENGCLNPAHTPPSPKFQTMEFSICYQFTNKSILSLRFVALLFKID